MGIKIGDIDIAQQGLETEFRLSVLEHIIEQIINSNPTLNKPTQEELSDIRKKVVELLKKKYPNSGIELTK
jgi:hypothetical protein